MRKRRRQRETDVWQRALRERQTTLCSGNWTPVGLPRGTRSNSIMTPVTSLFFWEREFSNQIQKAVDLETQRERLQGHDTRLHVNEFNINILQDTNDTWILVTHPQVQKNWQILTHSEFGGEQRERRKGRKSTKKGSAGMLGYIMGEVPDMRTN